MAASDLARHLAEVLVSRDECFTAAAAVVRVPDADPGTNARLCVVPWSALREHAMNPPGTCDGCSALLRQRAAVTRELQVDTDSTMTDVTGSWDDAELAFACRVLESTWGVVSADKEETYFGASLALRASELGVSETLVKFLDATNAAVEAQKDANVIPADLSTLVKTLGNASVDEKVHFNGVQLQMLQSIFQVREVGLSQKSLCRKLQTSANYLEPALQRLVGAGLVVRELHLVQDDTSGKKLTTNMYWHAKFTGSIKKEHRSLGSSENASRTIRYLREELESKPNQREKTLSLRSALFDRVVRESSVEVNRKRFLAHVDQVLSTLSESGVVKMVDEGAEQLSASKLSLRNHQVTQWIGELEPTISEGDPSVPGTIAPGYDCLPFDESECVRELPLDYQLIEQVAATGTTGLVNAELYARFPFHTSKMLSARLERFAKVPSGASASDEKGAKKALNLLERQRGISGKRAATRLVTAENRMLAAEGVEVPPFSLLSAHSTGVVSAAKSLVASRVDWQRLRDLILEAVFAKISCLESMTFRHLLSFGTEAVLGQGAHELIQRSVFSSTVATWKRAAVATDVSIEFSRGRSTRTIHLICAPSFDPKNPPEEEKAYLDYWKSEEGRALEGSIAQVCDLFSFL
jgi:DNA-binding MarR family transcriptional regulator